MGISFPFCYALRRTETLLRAVRACGAENYNHLKRKDLRNACMSKSQVFVCYSGSYFVARHNADLNLRVTESECVIRLQHRRMAGYYRRQNQL